VTGTRLIPCILWVGTFAAEEIAEDATLFDIGCDRADCVAAEVIDFFGAVTEAGCRAICDEFVGARAAICCLFAAAAAARAFVLSRNFSLRCRLRPVSARRLDGSFSGQQMEHCFPFSHETR